MSAGSFGRRRRSRWFDLGADALAVVRPNLPRGYACPLCLRLFSTPEGLSVEHCPPKSVGGRPRILTCTGCNSPHGHKLDAFIRTEADMAEIRAGRRSVRGRLTQYGKRLNADITFGPAPGIVVHEGNNPKAVDAALGLVQRDIEARAIPPEITLEFAVRHNARKADIAWLRAGYLYAFAAFGYSYLLRSCSRPIADQIARPGEELLPALSYRITSTLPERLTIVREPKKLASVVFTFQNRIVFLPGLGPDAADFYERMEAYQQDRGTSFFVRGQAFPLLSGPVFLFDLHARPPGPASGS